MGKEIREQDQSLSNSNTECFVLYSAPLSPCVRRCRITMLEKGLDFDTIDIDLANMQQRSPEYLALNPNGFVPTLCHGNGVIYESGVISEYLEEQFPETPLMPRDPYERARARMWVAAEGYMAKIFRPLMYQRLMGPLHRISRTHEEALTIAKRATSDPQDLAWESRVWNLQVLAPEEEAQEEGKLMAWLELVERALEGKQYLVGDRFSQADISMYPRVAMYDQAGMVIEESVFPRVVGWMRRLRSRPSFAASIPGSEQKLQRFLRSPLLKKVRAALSKPDSKRGIADRVMLSVVGGLVRRQFGVNTLLTGSGSAPSIIVAPLAEHDVQPRARTKTATNFMGELVLHGDVRCPYTLRIKMLLDSLGQWYRFVNIDSIGMSHPTTEYLALNPLGEVPTLQHGDRIVTGSSTIAEYLGDFFDSEGNWFADNSVEASRQRMWLALEAGNHKEFNPLWLRYVIHSPSNAGFIATEASALEHIATAYKCLEETLGQQPYLGGEQPKFADLAWFSRMAMLQQVPGIPLVDSPAIRQWITSMGATRENISSAVTGKLKH